MGEANKIAIDALQKKVVELSEARKVVRRRLLEDSTRDVEIDRDIAGCVAGAKALGEAIQIPKGPDFSAAPKQPAFTNFITGRNTIAQAYAALRTDYGIGDDGSDEEPENTDQARSDMPRIADIILEQLRISGEDGTRSSLIRQYILDTYDADIHEKTVGMTLYRLQKEGTVHRDGRIWFLGAAPIEQTDPPESAPAHSAG